MLRRALAKLVFKTRLNRGKTLIASIVAVLSIAASTLPSKAETQASNVDDLANSILIKEIELQKVVQLLHKFAATPIFNRTRRTWLWDMGNAVSTEGGLIGATALFFSHSHDRIENSTTTTVFDGAVRSQSKDVTVQNHAPGSQVTGTIIPQIAGQAQGASGSLYELGCDIAHSQKLRRKRLNGKAIHKRVMSLKRDIDNGLKQYEILVNSQTVTGINTNETKAEIKVLGDIRDRTLNDFVRLESRSLEISVGRIVEDAAGFTRNTVGLVGNSINVAAMSNDNKRLNGDGAILNLVSASMISLRPFVSNSSASCAKKACKDSEKRFSRRDHRAERVIFAGFRSSSNNESQ